MITEDYFSVEILGESPLRLYEAQYINMGSELDKMISESTGVIYETERSMILTVFREWVKKLLEKIREFKKAFKKKMNELVAKIHKKVDPVKVKIPQVTLYYDDENRNNRSKSYNATGRLKDLNKSYFSAEDATHAYNYIVKGQGDGPYEILDQVVVGDEWLDTEKTLSAKEFNKAIESVRKDCENTSEKIESTIKDIEAHINKTFYKEDGVTETNREQIQRARKVISYLEKIDRANMQYYFKFVKQS